MSVALARAGNRLGGEEGAITHSVCSRAPTQNAAPSQADGGATRNGPISQADLWEINTGWHQSPDQWRERSQAQRRLERQTARIADLVEAEGLPMRLAQGDVVDLSEVTGQVDRSEAYRSVCFLPLIAQRERRPILNKLRYFQRHHPQGRYMRYAVVTAGPRVPIHDAVDFAAGIYCPVTFDGGDRLVRIRTDADGPYCPIGPVEKAPGGPLRSEIQRLNRLVSRFSSKALYRYGIEVVLRADEFPCGDDLTIHPHANILYFPRRKMSRETWAHFLSWAHRFFGSHWHDAGRLQEPDEVLKYPFKPEDVDAMDGPCLAWLYEQTARLKMVQPMRSFARFCRGLELGEGRRDADGQVTDGRCCAVAIGPDGAWRPVAQKIAMVNRSGGARLELIRKATREPVDPDAEAPDDEQNENRILCRTSPQFRHCPYAEPVTRILNYTETPTTVHGRKRLEKIRAWQDEARGWWDANGAPDPATALAVGRGQAAAGDGAAQGVLPFKVHTCRPTVPAAEADRGASPPGDPPGGVSEGSQSLQEAPDGTLYDPETGEITDPDEEARAAAAERDRQHGDQVVAEFAAWKARMDAARRADLDQETYAEVMAMKRTARGA